MSTPDPDVIEPLIARFVEACREVFGDDRLIAVVLHGSVVKGGHVPHYSDIDFMVFLSPDCFDKYGLRLDLAFAIQERTAAMDWRSAGLCYFQAYYYDPGNTPSWWTGPVPGAYRMVWGELPSSLIATADRLRESGRQFLREQLPGIIAGSLSSFADSMDDALLRRVRLLGTIVNPAMFALVALQSPDPLDVWSRPKFDVMAALETLHPQAGAAVRRYFALASDVMERGKEADAAEARTAYRVGLEALIAVHRLAQRSDS